MGNTQNKEVEEGDKRGVNASSQGDKLGEESGDMSMSLWPSLIEQGQGIIQLLFTNHNYVH